VGRGLPLPQTVLFGLRVCAFRPWYAAEIEFIVVGDFNVVDSVSVSDMVVTAALMFFVAG